jgi:tRNA-dependent cyclodipeptide synthase
MAILASPSALVQTTAVAEPSLPTGGAAPWLQTRHVLGCIAVVGIAALMVILMLVQQLAPSSSPSRDSDSATGTTILVLPSNNSGGGGESANRKLLQLQLSAVSATASTPSPTESVQPLIVYTAGVGLLALTVSAVIFVLVFLRSVAHPCSVLDWRGLVKEGQCKENSDVHRQPTSHHHGLRCVPALACRALRCLVRGQWPWSASAVGLVHTTSGVPLPGEGWRWTAPCGELSKVNFIGRGAATQASTSLSSFGSSIYHVFVGLTPVVVLSSVSAVSAFYSAMKGPHGGLRIRDSRFSVLGSICNRLMGQSMGVKSGQEWDAIRKTFAPHFNPRAVSTSFDAVQEAVLQWLQREMEQGKLAQEGLLDVHGSRLHLLPLQVIAHLVYGPLPPASMRTLEGLCAEHSSLLGTLRHQSNRLPWLLLRLLKPSLCKRVIAFQRDWRCFNEHEVQRLQQLSAEDCILSCLLSKRASAEALLANAEWMDTIDEILLLNHDVTYIAMMAALTQLAVEPVAQEKLREELRRSRQQRRLEDDAVGTNADRSLYTLTDLADLRYLDAVVLESARCWPSIQLSFPERTAAACEVEGFHIPAHSVVVVDVEAVNHDPTQWPDPNRFDPDRFLHEPQLAQRFHRFGLSTRQCLGQRFAGLMVKLVIAHVVSRYRLRVNIEGVDDSTADSSLCSRWTLSMRDVKSDGLPYLTAYSRFPVLRCQPVGELALTSTLLPEPIFRVGLQRLTSGSGIGVLGMSLGNSFFSRYTISLFIPFLLRFFPQLWIFIPDVPAECTYAAMGYSPKEVKQKTRYNANRYRNWIKETVDSLSPQLRSRVRIIDWRNELSSHPVYQQRLADYQRAYREQQSPAFTVDVQATTLPVLHNKVKSGVDMAQALEQGVDFLLMELAFLTTFHQTLTQPSCNQHLVYVYHRRWPVFERLLMHQYELGVRHDSTMGFVMVDQDHGGESDTSDGVQRDGCVQV